MYSDHSKTITSHWLSKDDSYKSSSECGGIHRLVGSADIAGSGAKVTTYEVTQVGPIYAFKIFVNIFLLN